MERPYVSRNEVDIAEMRPPIFSLDYEWSVRTGVPSIVGISDATRTVSVQHDYGHPYICELIEKYPDEKWLGHNFCAAENEVLKNLGIQLKPEQILDSIVLHYLTSMNLCKSAKAKQDDEDGERKGRGFMNLGAMCILHTDCDLWKSCIGQEQCEEERRPCPDHNPFQYNGEDAFWPLKAWPRMWQIARMRGVDRLYPLHRDLLLTLQKVKNRGVLVDVPYVSTLRDDFENARNEMRATFSFNPDSPQQVCKHFNIEDATEETVREAAEDAEEGSEIVKLLEFKELGRGPDRWFGPRSYDYDKGRFKGFVDDDGYIHCSLGIFTSTGRFNCTGPNLQNVAKRRRDRRTGESLGKRIRRAIIAPPGYLLYRADYKSAEYRAALTLAGVRGIPEDMDFHQWLSGVMGIESTDPFAMSLGGPRDAAKSVMFGTIYLEGLKLLEPRELHKPKVMNEVAKGARLVFPAWKVFGKVVTFTGINLAKRALGGATLENRAKALSYVVKIFTEFPALRQWQIEMTRNVERDRAVRTQTGYVCPSYGYEEDRLKTAAAMHGSNPVAHTMKYAMVRADSHPMLNEANVLSVHDECLWYVDARHDPKKVQGWIKEVMEFPLPEIPELTIPTDCSVGVNWADQKEIV